MKYLLFAAAVLVASLNAAAFDATRPVDEVMAAVTANWQEMGSETDTPPAYVDYFSADFLNRLYSRDFAAKYHAAERYPAYDEGDSPFDYDVIAMGQDGCAIRDLTIAAAAAEGGATEVRVGFDNTHCFGERAADWKPNTVLFRIVTQDGRPVIDDIVRIVGDSPNSLKAEMEEIVTDGAAARDQAPE